MINIKKKMFFVTIITIGLLSTITFSNTNTYELNKIPEKLLFSNDILGKYLKINVLSNSYDKKQIINRNDYDEELMINLFYEKCKYTDWSKIDISTLENKNRTALMKEIQEIQEYGNTIIKNDLINIYTISESEKLKALEYSINKRQKLLGINETHTLYKTPNNRFYTEQELNLYIKREKEYSSNIKTIKNKLYSVKEIRNIIKENNGINIYFTINYPNSTALAVASKDNINFNRIPDEAEKFIFTFYHELGHIIDWTIFTDYHKQHNNILKEIYFKLGVKSVKLKKTYHGNYNLYTEAFANDFSVLMIPDIKPKKNFSAYDYVFKNLTKKDKEKKMKIFLNILREKEKK